MKAHLFVEGGGMVTGTHDKVLAQKLIVDAHLEQNCIEADDGAEILDALCIWSLQAADQEVGRIVPAGPDNDEYAWFWRTGYQLGKAGVTRAVVWHA